VIAAPDASAGAPVVLAVDKMLGRLVRWLRILGHDVAYGPHLSGATLVRCARDERRLLLTRDTHLLRDPTLPPHLFIRSDHFREQLREVAAVVPLGAAFLGRCLDCNRPLAEVPPAAVAARVPPYVLATQRRFLACAGCGRVYWSATHRTHMLDELARIGLDVAEVAGAR
jgi:uncharacterized protein with PIN domain